MKNLLTIMVLYLLLTISQAWSLPPCEGNVWNNCYGTWTYDDGQKYVGDWKDDKRHGQGTHTWADGSKYVGEYKDNKRHGQGTLTLADGAKYVGEYKDSKYHGQGTYTFNDGRKYVGDFKDGKYHGQGTYTFADGKVWEGQWSNDEWVSGKEYAAGEYNSSSQVSSLPPCEGEESNWQNCEGSLTSGSGTIYTGVFKDGIFDGKNEERNIKYVGEYKNGTQNGQGSYTFPNGLKFVGELKDGKRHGQGTDTWADGRKYVGDYKDGKRHGQGTFTFADGKVWEGQWSNDEWVSGKEYAAGEYNSSSQVSSLPPCEGDFLHNCYGTFTYDDGVKYVGEWKDNKSHGQGTMTYDTEAMREKHGDVHARMIGDEYIGEFKDGFFDGYGVLTYNDGSAKVGNWANGECKYPDCQKYAEGLAGWQKAQAEKERGIAIINKSKEIEQDNDNIRIALDALNYTFYGSKKDRYIIVLDAKNCIFEESATSYIKSSVFYLNNVIVDTIKFYNEPIYNESSGVWEDKIKITFSGDELVFSSGNSEYSEYKGAVSDRAEVERVQKAWGVIYSRTCEGASAGEF